MDDWRVLIAEDDEPIRTMLVTALERDNFVVEAVSDGIEAIELLEKKDYGLIILDLMMPRLGGLGILEYLEKHRRHLLGKVIVVTAVYPDLERASQFAVRRVVSKPFDVLKLLGYVREAHLKDLAAAAGGPTA